MRRPHPAIPPNPLKGVNNATVPPVAARIASTATGPLRTPTTPQNIGVIVPGEVTPPKILSCAIITDSSQRFVAHVHGTYLDYLHFLEVRGAGSQGGCPLCEAGVLVLDPLLVRVTPTRFVLLTNPTFTNFTVQAHPE